MPRPQKLPGTLTTPEVSELTGIHRNTLLRGPRMGAASPLPGPDGNKIRPFQTVPGQGWHWPTYPILGYLGMTEDEAARRLKK